MILGSGLGWVGEGDPVVIVSGRVACMGLMLLLLFIVIVISVVHVVHVFAVTVLLHLF